jgi:hypothetical protein
MKITFNPFANHAIPEKLPKKMVVLETRLPILGDSVVQTSLN